MSQNGKAPGNLTPVKSASGSVEPKHSVEEETLPRASPVADSQPASSSNFTDCVPRAEWNKLVETVAQLEEAIKRQIAQSSASVSTPDAPLLVQLKSAGGKTFHVKKEFFAKACDEPTLQAVVKSLALGLTTGSNNTIYFRGESRRETIAQQEFIDDLIAVTRLVLRKLDKSSKHAVLRIMRQGENLKLVRRSKKYDSNSADSTKITVSQRKKWFSGQLTFSQVKSWASAGFRECRRAN